MNKYAEKAAYLCGLLLLFALFAPLLAQKPIKNLRPTVILVALDGYRADYLEKFQPPTLNKLAKEGVRAKWLIPSFPSKTFPNHYAMVTGLYPQNNGIVENNIYDFGAVFGLSKKEELQNGRWWLGEPIWVTAEKQGQRAGAFFFPGTEAEIMGKRPTFWKEYDGDVPNETRVQAVLSWLDLPREQRPTVYLLYFSDVDDAGHAASPDAEETRRAVLNVDENLQSLMKGLKARKIDKKVNVIVVSDHGMAPAYQSNAVFLDDYFNLDDAERILWASETVQIFPKNGKLEEIARRLKTVTNANCWKKADIPARFHYNEGARVAPIVCSSNEGWALTSHERFAETRKREDFNKLKGAHGYDNNLESMRAIFVAHGQAFKKGKIVEPFENVNVYNVMTKILNLKPAPNDGNFNVAKQILK